MVAGHKNTLFSFVFAVGVVPDGCGICRPPGCCGGHLFGQGVSLQVILVSFRWEGWDLTICTFARVVVVPWGDGGWGCEGGVLGVGCV
jgi:hypothetical protein